jgi:hypothetical protein
MLVQQLATSEPTLAPQSRASSPDRSQRVGPHPWRRARVGRRRWPACAWPHVCVQHLRRLLLLE